MSPCPAIRHNGACTGSLWKSHSRSTVPPPRHLHSAKIGVGDHGLPSVSGIDSPEVVSSLDGILAKANERQRSHEFCVLVGNMMWSYSDVWAYTKGDPPTSEIRIVGASAWNRPPAIKSFSGAIATKSGQSYEAIPPPLISSKSVDFLIVTYSGTHVRCSAPSPSDKDEWLAALHAGVEGNIMDTRVETLLVLGEAPRANTKISLHHTVSRTRNSRRRCRYCKESDIMVQAALSSSMTFFESEVTCRPFASPLPVIELKTMSSERALSSGTDNICVSPCCGVTTDASACLHTTGYHSPCDDRTAPLSGNHCTVCGRYPPEPAMRIDAAPLPEYGMEVRVDLCHDCCIAQGVLHHVRYLGWLYEVEASGRASICLAWKKVQKVVDRIAWENAGLINEGGIPFDGMRKWSSQLVPTNRNYEAIAGALLELTVTESFMVHRRRSISLDSICREFQTCGSGFATEFMESIEEVVRTADGSCHFSLEQGLDRDTKRHVEKICLKKEAFKVAGDMSAALKLLYEYALSPERRNLPLQSSTGISSVKDSGGMLAAILEFFLDLCDEGQLEAVAFFWPQLCHIHMQMLPPRDTDEMVRVELMEDFLLTVSTHYSVHLALELVWGLTADLEESLGSSNCHALNRRRRFAVLRFVSELESILFDFDGGWGGGSISLNGMLAPSQHQAALLKDAMSLLQLHRRFGSHYLTKSIRLEKLRAEALDSLSLSDLTPEDTLVRNHIAKNAAYYSSHITFARKLGNIAENLRFMEVENRPEKLREELKKVNASAKILGGDPLNRLCASGQYQRTVHIPINEGHVFRSKERTPVLLLAELVMDSCDLVPVVRVSPTTQNFRAVAGFNWRPEPCSLKDFKCIDDDLLEASNTSLIDNVETGIDSCQCPQIPPTFHPLNYSPSNSLRRPSHGVLSLTPRASEAKNVTDEGKEMMADLIASLIVNQKSFVGASALSKNVINHTHSDNRDPTKYRFPPMHLEDHAVNSLQEFAPTAVDENSFKIEQGDSRKISALGSVFPQLGQGELSTDLAKGPGIYLTADGQFRRDVLFAIMERGMRGSNVIAKGAATAARRAIQVMDRKRAIALMNESTSESDDYVSSCSDLNEGIPGCANGVKPTHKSITINASVDEGEVIEALRLLIIQNQVAHENLSPENAVKIASPPCTAESEANSSITVDAGDFDHRLAGCGQVTSSVLSALRLWKGGIVSSVELLELVQKDLQFLKQSAVFGSADENKLNEDSAFWGRFSFGERWAEKKARLAASSPFGSLPKWDLIGCIVKSNDDLRQEAFVMQMIGLCQEAFQTAGLDLWVHPYNIIATGLSTGVIECVRNAMSFDSLKKRPGYGSKGLVGHFERMTEIAADPLQALNEAKQNFVSSLAAYSLMSYLFLFKDRHNGNLLLDSAGHVIHIDFGFVFGIAPGGSFSLEQSTPFKLTDEMLEVMGGLGSPLFSEFVTLFCCGFLVLQAHADTFLTVTEITCRGSNFHCFSGKDPEDIVSKLRERFSPELSKSQSVAYALDLIKFATTSYGTKQYDYFQYLSQGIAT